VAQVVECIATEESKLERRQEMSSSEEPPFVAKAVQSRLSNEESRLLQSYVLRAAEPLVHLVQEAVQDNVFTNMDQQDVAPPRAWCEDMRSRVTDIALEAAAVLPPGADLPATLVRMRHPCYWPVSALFSAMQCRASHPSLLPLHAILQHPEETCPLTCMLRLLPVCQHALRVLSRVNRSAGWLSRSCSAGIYYFRLICRQRHQLPAWTWPVS
jgi:hypothetical protein